jgi:peptidoglycan/xylan/chitin deacetylase (PgdA/CDA1 family)
VLLVFTDLPLLQMKKALKPIIKATGLRRHHVAAGRMFCERHGLATMSRFRSPGSRSTGRILCYHSIGQAIGGVNDVSSRQFRRHIELALRLGFRFVPAAQIARTGGTARDLAITFDDGWTSVLSTAAPILSGYNIPWLLFVVSSWSDHGSAWTRQYILPWHDLERLVATGVQIGSHSATHPDFGSIGGAQMVDELYGSRETIQRRLGFAPTTFAIPLGQSKNWTPAADKIAREAGYETVFAQAEEARPSGTIARTFVTRFDGDRIFSALLNGAYDRWQEWV